MRIVLAFLLAASSPAIAAPDKPTLALVGADGIDPSTHYLVALPDVLEAARKRGDDIAACAGNVRVDLNKPTRSLSTSVYLKVAADGHVLSVDVTKDPSTGVDHKDPHPAARCVAPIVKKWTFAHAGDVLLRFVVDLPVKRDPKVPDAYVKALTAVCDAFGSPKPSVNEQVELIRAALAKSPSSDVEALLRAMGGLTTEMRMPVLRSVLANAGLSACRAFDI